MQAHLQTKNVHPDGTPVWYCHTGEQFRDEKFTDECDGGPDHTGWFTNNDCSTYKDGSGKARGIVGRLTHERFIAGYHWGDNGERVYYPEVFEDETEAARMVDEHARVFAESAREDNARFEVMRDCENAETEARDEFKLAYMARHVSAQHLEKAREALQALRKAREELQVTTADYEKG